MTHLKEACQGLFFAVLLQEAGLIYLEMIMSIRRRIAPCGEPPDIDIGCQIFYAMVIIGFGL